MSQREKRDAYSAKSETKPGIKSSKGWPMWLVGIIVSACVAGLGAGIAWSVDACNANIRERIARRQSLSENELGIYEGSGIFEREQYARPMAREVMVQGWNREGEEMKVLVPSIDNITVGYRVDGKNFPTIKLTGHVANGAAEGAVILVPANDTSYYEEARREVHAKHASYENCPKCNPSKK